MRVFLSFSILALGAGVPFQPRSRTVVATLRGGDVTMPIDPELAAKLLTGVILTQGTATFLAPKNVAAAYGRETTPISALCTASWGAIGMYEQS